ncbi:hypothetical protein BS50DRAFT_593719 [Corynespora cassiicola Philippines]|uniref:Uncharacterized protein n=1 Tax=Corynespora cassiicola Philippines TaxID=1448308 RepID=A0A2T2N5V7_CORCC|nr:hypothetical protein BS50DRAFT_593719 [Corynespora cassiicola Philippines]
MIVTRGYYGTFKRPPSETSGDESGQSPGASKSQTTLYDAVAGRASADGLIDSQNPNLKGNQPLRPDEVLFKQCNAPTRYEETDCYFAHENLPQGQRLPSGDLLEALHAYMSNYYAKSQEQGGRKVWKCMDETALIALGILMEETAKEALGATGDLAFLEGADEDEEASTEGPRPSQSATQRSQQGMPMQDKDAPSSDDSSSLSSSVESD